MGRRAKAYSCLLALLDIIMNSAHLTMQRVSLLRQRPALASIYSEWYQLVRDSLSEVDGKILELGSGGGFIKDIIPTAVTSDVLNGDRKSVV